MSVDAEYAVFARRISESGFINDPWLNGRPRFAARPVVLTPAEHRALLKAGEDLAAVIDEAVHILREDDAQRRAFLPSTKTHETLLQASGGLWHGVARADVFFTAEGLQVTELNSDTPTGEPEAIVLGALGVEDHPGLVDANASLASRIAALWQTMHRHLVGDGERTAAIIYPTEFTEDLSLIRLYRQILEECGWNVVLGSPFNLVPTDDGGVALFGVRPTLVVRHYKADWWCERASVWTDDHVRDSTPLAEPLMALLNAEAAGRLVIVNPFGAIAAQNKRLLAFCWERIHRFSTSAQQIIERLIPYTARLEAVHEAQLRADKDRWVLKSDYGAEGDEVVIGRLVDEATWDRVLRLARPDRFVAQRFFDAVRDDEGRIRNHGVFVVGGEACGVYTRLDAGHTDPSALSVPTLVRPA